MFSVKLQQKFQASRYWRLFTISPYIFKLVLKTTAGNVVSVREELPANKSEKTKPAANLFECALHVYALVPGRGRVGQAVAGVASAANVDLLAAEGAESFGHHQHAVVRQR